MYLTPIQHRLLEFSGQFGTFTMSLNSSVLCLGIAMGSLFGGGFISIWQPHWLGIPAFFIGCLTLWVVVISYKYGNPS